jgi:hypothetical protein
VHRQVRVTQRTLIHRERQLLQVEAIVEVDEPLYALSMTHPSGRRFESCWGTRRARQVVLRGALGAPGTRSASGWLAAPAGRYRKVTSQSLQMGRTVLQASRTRDPLTRGSGQGVRRARGGPPKDHSSSRAIAQDRRILRLGEIGIG